MSSSRNVYVSLVMVIVGSAQADVILGLADDALDDETVGRLGQQDLVQATLVDEGTDGAQDLLVVLPRTTFVDSHREPPWISLVVSWLPVENAGARNSTGDTLTIDARAPDGNERPAVPTGTQVPVVVAWWLSSLGRPAPRRCGRPARRRAR